ncbi:TetR/AcrR family transcriptional regulator [Mycobacterium sp. CPCC 205372]|uniref:TetR/AcrR family transcriptional regulator n=1 Tax=Mycobacterium hippophais TaxID=3016340 RepID=A0ABT4PW78_9MYCO|nr:TetR/AcrR family transcriptional regulator [Mycobacterium hippophais]MCZ8380790.1 TetR/AcrR family transcriptional regulator [Mycobacterium hippophais]
MSAPYERMVDAVLRALLAEGFEGVSVRKVAAVAGVSIGAVQHHFPTRDAMLDAAMDRAAQRFRDRLADRLPAGLSPAQLCAELAVALVSADDRDVSVIWLLRLARAAVDEGTAARHRREWRALEDHLAGVLADAGVDDRAAAVELLALLDGLACSVAVEPGRVSAELAERIVRGHVARLLSPARPPARGRRRDRRG